MMITHCLPTPQVSRRAAYCEKSYQHSEHKQMVLDYLKDYAIQPLVNALENVTCFTSGNISSTFLQEVIVNKSRAGGRAMVSEISLQIDDFDKIPHISEEIKNIMKSNSNVFLEKEQPYCYLSRAEKSFFVLSIGCNLKQMSKDELLSTEQDILLQSIQIIKNHGVNLASTQWT